MNVMFYLASKPESSHSDNTIVRGDDHRLVILMRFINPSPALLQETPTFFILCSHLICKCVRMREWQYRCDHNQISSLLNCVIIFTGVLYQIAPQSWDDHNQPSDNLQRLIAQLDLSHGHTAVRMEVTPLSLAARIWGRPPHWGTDYN